MTDALITGEQIKQGRLEFGLTGEDLAKLVGGGCTKSRIAEWEAKYRNRKISRIYQERLVEVFATLRRERGQK